MRSLSALFLVGFTIVLQGCGGSDSRPGSGANAGGDGDAATGGTSAGGSQASNGGAMGGGGAAGGANGATGGSGQGGNSGLCPNGGSLPSNVTFNITSDSAKLCVDQNSQLCALPKGYCARARLLDGGDPGLEFVSDSVVLPLTATSGPFNGAQAMMVSGSIEIDVKSRVPYLHPGTWYWYIGLPTLDAICLGHGKTYQNVNYDTTEGASGTIVVECGTLPPVVPVKVGLECVLPPASCQ